MEQLFLTFIGSSVLTAIVGYFVGAKLQKVKIEGEYLQNHQHIIDAQTKFIADLEARFESKCVYMQGEVDRLQEEINVLKKKLNKKGI